MPTSDHPYRTPELQTGDLPSRGRKLIVAEINGLRGVAILGVMFGHVFAQSISKMHPTLFGFRLMPFLAGGWLGVNLFFILSAFVLFLPYVAGERDIHAPGALWLFYKHRALRLLPTYYLIVGAEMAFSGRLPFGDEHFTHETLSLVSFTFPFMPGNWMPASVNGPLWSLGTEVLFSAVFPLLCWLCLRFGAARVLVVALPVGFLVRLLGFELGLSMPVSWLEALVIGRVDEFLWGFLLAEAFVRGRLPRRPYLLWISGATILVPVLETYAGLRLVVRFFVGANNPFLFHLFLSGLVTVFDVAAVLFVAAALAGSSLWSAFLNMRWLRVAGMACYSLYLWHDPLQYWLRVGSDPWNLPNLFGFLLFLCILSTITYRFVEFRNVADWRSLFLINEPRRPRSIAAMAISPEMAQPR